MKILCYTSVHYHTLTPDNGGKDPFATNFPKRGHKWSLLEGGVNNLCLVSGPLLPNKQRGKICNELMHCTDWYPTLIDVAGGSTAGMKLYGVNQWKTIR